MAFTLPTLAYDHNALEPHIDTKTMEIHHGKHHQAYINNVNAAIAGTEMDTWAVDKLIANISDLPADKQGAIRNNGGGHFNHSLFWSVLTPTASDTPQGDLADAITASFGSLEEMKAKFAAAGATRFGSGWAWLIVTTEGKLAVTSTPNQDNPLMNGIAETTGSPILCLDVWEHAYYLNYQNRRPDYIAAFWNVVDWKAVAANYSKALNIVSA